MEDKTTAVNYRKIPSPAFVLEETLLKKNLELLRQVRQKAGVSIILALKGFSMWKVFPLIREYLDGAAASSLYEARLIREEMGCYAHTYAPAYIPQEFPEILDLSSHITFNSIAQYHLFKEKLKAGTRRVSPGIRVNPEFSVAPTALYDPCAPGSRLGEVIGAFKDGLPEGIEGLHFHTLCESNSHDLEKVLRAFENRFNRFFSQINWVNFGGGHLMTHKDYHIGHLIGLLRDFQRRTGLEVILEPGSAVAWETGDLVASVLDIFESGGIKTAMVDVSFTAHMPDTLEMPYRPAIAGAGEPAKEKFNYRIGGMSCLAGDYMEAYGFDHELQIGEKMVFKDMMHYTMVKTTMFNGVKHPDIYIWKEDGRLEAVRKFTYEDYRGRLS